MTLATPTVTSNVTSIPEVVDGCAMTINPYDIDQLAEAMHIVLEDRKLWEHYSHVGFKKSRELSWRNTAKKTLEAFLHIGKTYK